MLLCHIAGADGLITMGTVKRQVQAAFFDAGLTLEREALNTFVAFVEENGEEEELVYSLLDSSVQGLLSLAQSIHSESSACASTLHVLELDTLAGRSCMVGLHTLSMLALADALLYYFLHSNADHMLSHEHA